MTTPNKLRFISKGDQAQEQSDEKKKKVNRKKNVVGSDDVVFKYSVGQEIFTIRNNKIVKLKIVKIKIEHIITEQKTITQVLYVLNDNKPYKEDELITSLDQLPVEDKTTVRGIERKETN